MRPRAEPFASAADRDAWRAHVEERWWRRIVHAHASGVIARGIFPYLLVNDPENAGIAPWTRDFLMVIWINCLDRVLLTGVELLHTRTDIHSFEALKDDLQPRCQPDAWPEWKEYLEGVLLEARNPSHLSLSNFEDLLLESRNSSHLSLRSNYEKAKLARNRLVAHSSRDPLRGVSDFEDLRIKMGEVLDLQEETELAFGCFPEGSSWRIRPAAADHYPDLIARIVSGDVAGLPMQDHS